MKVMAAVPVLVLLCLHHSWSAPVSPDPHGGVKMGVINHVCDDAKTHLEVDWSNSTDYDYTCQTDESHFFDKQDEPIVECIPEHAMPRPLHKCMRTVITYADQPPRAGPHRPLWPVYGEYLYVPPQRWVHSLEHGAAVFLYHPCADKDQIEQFKALSRGCLRKHVITPYRLPRDDMFAVVTYGCRLLLRSLDEEEIVKYVRGNALTAPEKTPKEGQYTLGLLHQAGNVTDYSDSGGLCPGLPLKPTKRPPMMVQNDINRMEGIDSLEKRLGRRVIM